MFKISYQTAPNSFVGGKDLSFYVGLKASFTNNNASKKEKVLGKTP